MKSVRTVLLAFLCSTLLACAVGENEEPSDPRHVVLVTIDTLRADHLGLYGYPRPTTPFLDELGQRSVVFERAFAACSHTGPSHASLFTGLEPAQHRLLQNGEELDPAVATLAMVFRSAGYRTAAFTPVKFLKGLRAGFDDFHFQQRYQPAEVILDEARRWITDQPAVESLFVWIHLFDVHEWHDDRYIDPGAVEAMAAEAPAGEDLLRYLQTHRGLPSSGRSQHRVPEALDRYDSQLRYTDQALSDFFHSLGETDFQSQALWIFTADHGEGLGNHDHMGHGKYIYNEQLHVPLIVHASAEDFPARRVKDLVALVDVAPTLGEWLGKGFEQPIATLQGRSLLPLLNGRGGEGGARGKTDKAQPRWIFAQRRPVDDLRRRKGWEEGDIYSLQSESDKFIVHSSGAHEYFDLLQDPFELENLYTPQDDDQDALLRRTVKRYRQLLAEGERVSDGEIKEEYIQELKALGYL